MHILLKPSQFILRERGSKFLCCLFSCKTEEEFSLHLSELKAKYPDASHHCYAWRINPVQVKEYSSDAGEPSGTAGLPVLNQLRSFEMINTGAVVVRYFGGTKLGKAGLIEAYSSCTKSALEQAQTKEVIAVQVFKIQYPYSEENLINKWINSFEIRIVESIYVENVSLKAACPISLSDAFETEIEKSKYLDIQYEKLEITFL